MYAHGQVFDAIEGKMVDVGNNVQEAVARDPKRFFLSREAHEAALAADLARKDAADKATAEAASWKGKKKGDE